VPKKRGTGSLIVSILIADLVFLSALWTIFNYSVQVYLSKHDPDMHKCYGCQAIDNESKGEGYQLVNVLRKTSQVNEDDDGSTG
jgi:hypothetical protein